MFLRGDLNVCVGVKEFGNWMCLICFRKWMLLSGLNEFFCGWINVMNKVCLILLVMFMGVLVNWKNFFVNWDMICLVREMRVFGFI